MLKLIALAACVIGFVVVGPKALAEFREARAGSRTRTGDGGDGDKKPESSVAA
jgi:hypothetical protein